MLWPQSGQRVGSDGALMTAVREGKGARVQCPAPACKSVPIGAFFPTLRAPAAIAVWRGSPRLEYAR
ncbi:hypothetical protein D3C71_2077070 [compost metagenome]